MSAAVLIFPDPATVMCESCGVLDWAGRFFLLLRVSVLKPVVRVTD